MKHHSKHAGFFLAIMALVFNVSVLSLYQPGDASAGGGGGVYTSPILQLSASSSSVPVGTTVTLTAASTIHICNNNYYATDCSTYGGIGSTIPAGGNVTASVAGEGASIGGVAAGGASFYTCCSAGPNATFTLSATTPGTKTVTIKTTANFAPPASASVAVTFTGGSAPPTPAPAKKPTPTPSVSSAPAATPSATAVESKIGQVSLNGEALGTADPTQSGDDTKVSEFKEGDTINVSGTAAPNSKVKLYIFSDPKTAEVTADATGKWTYEITGLAAGSHHLEVASINTAGQESTRQVLGSFKVLASNVPDQASQTAPVINNPTKKQRLSTGVVIAIAITSFLAIAYTIWYWWHHRKSLLNHHNWPHSDKSA